MIGPVADKISLAIQAGGQSRCMGEDKELNTSLDFR
jgi:molybdopterin-guanine dinucleotide biosynthesis protein A